MASSSQTDPPFPDTSPFLTKKVPRTPQILHNDLPPLGGIFLFWYRLNKSMFPDSSYLFSLLSTCPTVHQLAWPSGPITVTGRIALLEVAMTAGAASVPWKLCMQQVTPRPSIWVPALAVWQPQSFQMWQPSFCWEPPGQPAGGRSACRHSCSHSVLVSQRQKWLQFDPALSIPPGQWISRFALLSITEESLGFECYLYINV